MAQSPPWGCFFHKVGTGSRYRLSPLTLSQLSKQLWRAGSGPPSRPLPTDNFDRSFNTEHLYLLLHLLSTRMHTLWDITLHTSLHTITKKKKTCFFVTLSSSSLSLSLVCLFDEEIYLENLHFLRFFKNIFYCLIIKDVLSNLLCF